MTYRGSSVKTECRRRRQRLNNYRYRLPLASKQPYNIILERVHNLILCSLFRLSISIDSLHFKIEVHRISPQTSGSEVGTDQITQIFHQDGIE